MKKQVILSAMSFFLLAGSVIGAEEDRFKGGSFDGWDCYAMTDAQGLGDPIVSFSSGSDQLFYWTEYNPALASMTLEVEESQGVITNGVVMRIAVPEAWRCRFDAGVAVSYGGSAAGKVGAAGFSGDDRVLEIPVTSDFADGDVLTISGLKLLDLSLVPHGTGRLELDFTGDGERDTSDLYVLQLRVQWPGGSFDGWDCHAALDYEPLSVSSGTIFRFR